MTYNIQWDVFTREEHDAITKMLEMGKFKSLSGAVLEMTPEKEIEIQKLADYALPKTEIFESTAHTAWRIEQQKKTNGASADPQTPEEEAELQAILDKEMKEHQEAMQMKTMEKQEALAEATKPKEVKETKKEETKK